MLQIKIVLNQNDNLLINAVYKPPNTNPHQFINNLQHYSESPLFQTESYNILIGDINIDLLKNNELNIEYNNTLKEFGFISTINNPTRVQGGHSSCIDHIFFKSKQNVPDQILWYHRPLYNNSSNSSRKNQKH
ncbi:hypothetical protein JTB14_018164 [Gonioctena quinquepunctata]|nr:hypothetical protein JTB14_018164 [Gonioctena quinquepunctata]